MRRAIVLAAAVIMASGGAASAAPLIFGVDFGSGPTFSGTGVLGETFSGAGGTEHIPYSNGTDTGATVDLSGPFGGSAGSFDAAANGSPNALFEDGLSIGNKGPRPGQTSLGYVIQADLTGLTPNTPYQIAIYTGSDGFQGHADPGSSQVVDFGTGGASDVLQVVTQDSSVPNYRSSFILGEDYALSVETSDATGKLSFQVAGNNSAEPILNGFAVSSVVSVPEPATFAVLFGGVFGSLLLRSRTRKMV